MAMVDFSTTACLASVGVCLLEWGGSQWLRTSVDTDHDNWKGSGRPPYSFNSLIADGRKPFKPREGKGLARSHTVEDPRPALQAFWLNSVTFP